MPKNKNIKSPTNNNNNKSYDYLNNNNSNNILDVFSNNKLLIGLVAIFVNIGSRYIEIKLTPNQENFLKNIGREVLIFTISLLYTRDIVIAIIVTSSFIVLSNYVFNEQSNFCILPDKYKNINSLIDTNNDGIITDAEVKNAETVLEKAKNQKKLHNKLFMLNNLY